MVYGTNACYYLAQNELSRGMESTYATMNADNYAYIVAGTSYKYLFPSVTLRATPLFPVSFLHLNSM